VRSLSQVTGQEVVGPNGEVVGRVRDLTARLDDEAGPELVERILVRRNRGTNLLLPWAAAESFERTGVRLHGNDDPTIFAITTTTDALADDEILLVRDVLDTQIIDIAGQRMARVADVVLNRRADGRLELVGVEVGFRAVLQRFGLRRTASRCTEDVVVWTDLHLTSERGHAVQLATPRSAVHHLDAAGLAALISRLDTESATEVLAVREPRIAADAVCTAHPAVAERVLRAISHESVEQIMAAMPVEHATRWRDRIARTSVLRGRRFLRFRVWPRRRDAPVGGRHTGGTGSRESPGA
jgi:sporulation protein YlmC with PRC-barrel domain